MYTVQSHSNKRSKRIVNYLVMRSYIKSHEPLQEDFRRFVIRKQCIPIDVISNKKNQLRAAKVEHIYCSNKSKFQ